MRINNRPEFTRCGLLPRSWVGTRASSAAANGTPHARSARLAIGNYGIGNRGWTFTYRCLRSRGPLRPIGGRRGIAITPVGAWWSLDGILRQSLDEFVRKASDDVPAGPIRHTVNPDDKAAGRKPA